MSKLQNSLCNLITAAPQKLWEITDLALKELDFLRGGGDLLHSYP